MSVNFKNSHFQLCSSEHFLTGEVSDSVSDSVSVGVLTGDGITSLVVRYNFSSWLNVVLIELTCCKTTTKLLCFLCKAV